jgi:hypothetical protein
MAVYNKFNQFTKDLIDGKHNFASNVFKIMLTNVAPLATNQIKSDITEIAAGLGYTAGGTATTITESTTSGVAKIVGSNVVFTATGAMATFQYAVLYNDTTASPLKPLIAWWDYGTPISMVNTETLTVAFDATNGIFQVS